MPIVLRSTGPDRVYNALYLVNAVLEEVREAPVTTIEGDDVPLVARRALSALNAIEQRLWEALGIRYGQDTWEEQLRIGTAAYTLPDDWQDMDGDPRIEEYQLLPMTVDEWYSLAGDRFQRGLPERYILKDGVVNLWPVPGAAAMLDKCVYDDLLWYVCVVNHTAGATHLAPSAGNTTDWALTAVDFGDEDYTEADFAWTTGKQYSRGYMDTPYTKGLTILAGNADVPMLPARAYAALEAGACWRMKAHRGFTGEQVAEQKRFFEDLEADLIAKRRFQHNNPRDRMGGAIIGVTGFSSTVRNLAGYNALYGEDEG